MIDKQFYDPCQECCPFGTGECHGHIMCDYWEWEDEDPFPPDLPEDEPSDTITLVVLHWKTGKVRHIFKVPIKNAP